MKVGSHDIKLKTVALIGVITMALVIVIIGIVNGLQDPYTLEVLNFRKQKDEHFKMDKDSPVEDQISFKSLSYFAPDENFRVKPQLILFKDSASVYILNNDGEKNKYNRFAFAVFELGGQRDTLVVYRKASLKKEDKSYFLPFYDATNENETYGGGRYIDLKIEDVNNCIVDFNFAYNPYCLYDHHFSCPIPPKENRLNSRVEAGEKKFVK